MKRFAFALSALIPVALTAQQPRPVFDVAEATIPQMQAALAAIPARKELIAVEGGPHGLSPAIASWLPTRLSKFVAC